MNLIKNMVNYQKKNLRKGKSKLPQLRDKEEWVIPFYDCRTCMYVADSQVFPFDAHIIKYTYRVFAHKLTVVFIVYFCFT